MIYQNEDADILFPTRAIPSLRDLRGPVWQELIDHVSSRGATSVEQQAFMLMMIRLDGCLTCSADSYRAMLGCTLCAQQAISRFKGSDQDLIDAYLQAKTDVLRWHEQGLVPPGEQPPPEIEL
jgi:hypothetical protein